MAQAGLDPKKIPQEEARRQELARELHEKAHAAQARGELLSAMLYAADALMLMPNDRTCLDLVDEIALATNDPLSLVPVATGAVHIATAAARARILMMQKDLAGAIDLLCLVVDTAPDVAYFDWVRRWLMPQVIPQLGWDRLRDGPVNTALKLMGRAPPACPPDHPVLPNIRAGVEILSTLKQHFPQEPSLYFGESALRRRLGDAAATVAAAEQGVQRFPGDWRTLTAMANALGDAGRPDEALQYARRAMQVDAQDNSPLHDAAWAFVKANRFDDAAKLFGELVSREADYPGGQAACHYARFRAYGTAEDKQALVRMREVQWWDDAVQDLAEELEPAHDYENYLPGPGDATASAAHHLADELGHVLRCCGATDVSIALTSEFMESPSVGIAFDVALRSMGARGQIDLAVERVQQPDPRADKAQTAFRLWSFEGTTPKKVYGAADPRVHQAIAHLADQVFSRTTWDPLAQQIAQQYGADWVHAFLAVLTDPPPPPAHGGFDGIIWTYRCQIATAVVLSHLGPWQTGPARSAVFSLIYGPSDWLTSAGLVALAWRAKQDPALRSEAESVFQWMRGQIPAEGYTPWEDALSQLWLGLGNHPPAVEHELKDWIATYERTVHLKNTVRPPERRYGGLTLDQYAEFSFERDKIMHKVGYQGRMAAIQNWVGEPPQELAALCQRFNIPLRQPQGGVYPYIREWQEAMNASPDLHRRFIELTRSRELAKMGVNAEEKAALDEILDGNMDMHLRMAQAQEAQRAVASGDAGDPDPVVFPGQKVARLSDYVGIMKGMQRGDMMGALGRYGLDMMSYGSVAQAWGAKMAADPVLTEKFSRMMNS